MQEKLIEYSVIESQSFDLKVGRCVHGYFDDQKLLKDIVKGSFDLCRVKVPSEDEYVVNRLNNLGFPFFFSGSIRRYKTAIEDTLDLEFNHKDLEFETCTEEFSELFLKLLVDTWGDYPIGYYRSPILNQLINKDAEIQSVFNFYRANNLNGDRSKNSIKLIKHRGNYVGFFALNKINGHLESHIGGILNQFRKEGYFHDMLVYIKRYCQTNDLSHFIFGARNENAKVQKVFHYAGFVPIGTENVFHITPLISFIREKGGEEVLGETMSNHLIRTHHVVLNDLTLKMNEIHQKNYRLKNYSFQYEYDANLKFISGKISQIKSSSSPF